MQKKKKKADKKQKNKAEGKWNLIKIILLSSFLVSVALASFVLVQTLAKEGFGKDLHRVLEPLLKIIGLA